MPLVSWKACANYYVAAPQKKIAPTLHLFKFILKNDKELGCSVSKLLCGWLCGLRLYPLFISSGILTRGGFGQEMKTRIYERFTPLLKILMIYVIFFIYYLEIKMMHAGLMLFL